MEKNAILELLSCASEFKVSNRLHIVYVTDQERKINHVIMGQEREQLMLAKHSHGLNITNTERLRFIEAVLGDPVEIMYIKSQYLMTM